MSRSRSQRLSRDSSDRPLDAQPPTRHAAWTEYQRRRSLRLLDVQRHQRRSRLAVQARLATFLLILAIGYAALVSAILPPVSLLAALAAFVAAVVWHVRVRGALGRSQRAVAWYDRALARLEDRWAGTGPSGSRYCRPDHPYAADLDLFGHGSLFQRLCAARTQMGQDTLAAWLLASADVPTILARQQAIRELRDEIQLRESLAVLDARTRLDAPPQTLRAWIAGPPLLTGRARPAIAAVLAVASVSTLTAWVSGLVGAAPFLAVVFLQAALLVQLRSRMRELTRNLDSVLGELNLVLEVLRIMEGQHFDTPHLNALLARLRHDGLLPSRQVARLLHLADAWETIWRNLFVAPLAFLLMLGVHLAWRIERWRLHHAHAVCDWLDLVGQFEALCSLSGYAYEEDQSTFPRILETGTAIDARGLAHPLIPASKRVSNDLSLGPERHLLLVSGSNMSGKSTLLRTVGINVALALAGAPVTASDMHLSRLAIASSMRVSDSLADGVSAFYAEIQRLRRIHDLAAGSLPVLFLLDEILHGTNSHDRRLGAEAVVRGLLQRGAIGLVTTHDLALAEIADGWGPRAANVHFEDQFSDGRIRFDYQLRPGVVPKGNGLVLMRLLGFEV